MRLNTRWFNLFLLGLISITPAVSQTSYDVLEPGAEYHGFLTTSVYLNDSDQPMGASFVHQATGFVFDALRIESVPQSFIWVNSFPTSDMGEPHTQEHLLLGKGNVGRRVAGLEQMSMTRSSAFTLQWRTCYHAHTASGSDVYFDVLSRQLDALLHPDYTDEEIRREVRNFGVTQDPDGTLRLEEKGTVYNEMVSSSDRPWSPLFREIGDLLYGTDHPLAYSAGGWPPAIREMQPEDIRKFHADTHHLANMGMVGSYPSDLSPDDILLRMNSMLKKLQGDAEKRRGDVETDLPAPKSAPSGKISIAEFPHENAQQPGNLVLAWPANRDLPRNEKLLLDLFLDNIAGDPTTNLYKIFIDSQSREMELDAKQLFSWKDDDLGQPVYIGLGGIGTTHLNEETIGKVRARVLAEIEAIAALPDGSAELAAFNARVQSRVVESQRELSKLVNSPPSFGFRSSGSGWMWHLYRLSDGDDFRVSVTMKPELAFVEQQLAKQENIWRDYLTGWKLAGVTPYAIAAKPSPELLERGRVEREARLAAEVKRLQALYELEDAQEAILRYKQAYDATSEELELLSRGETLPPLVDSPPMTLDDQLDYEVGGLEKVQFVASSFPNMTAATTGVAFRLNEVPAQDLLYVSLLPELLREVGVIRDGKPVEYAEMSEALKNEILSLAVYFKTNHTTGRCELATRGAGNNLKETLQAIEWMKLVLAHPNWGPDNLSRIRDVVDQELGRLRNTMQGSEESWVQDPAQAFRRQDSPHLLATTSFLTRAHNAHRLRWLLKEAGEDGVAVSRFLAELANAADGSSREDLETLLAMLRGDAGDATEVSEDLAWVRPRYDTLPESARGLVDEAVKDLSQLLIDLPDNSMAQDWAYLCGQMRSDLQVLPADVLANLNRVRAEILERKNARMFFIGSRDSQIGAKDELRSLLKTFPKGETTARRRVPQAAPSQPILARLQARQPSAKSAMFFGLVAPNMKGGVFINRAKGTSYHDTDADSMLDYLSSRIYAGGGAHGIFMKTWGAGLAYSNGVGGSLAQGSVSYYAERTPELPQTLRFVIDYVSETPRDPSLVGYVIAQAFGDFRSASGYESRGEAMADDLTDGLAPDVVRKFREAALTYRDRPDLIDDLYDRLPNVYGKVLPGFGIPSKDVEGASYFVIGPPRQLELYEEYLQGVEGEGTEVYLLYPRDFWMTAGGAADNNRGGG